jgi:crotonobetainyl-CoA:carnitine CoA-transferase CaiB-like acyl-CoA transferase
MVQHWGHPLADQVDLVASPLKLSATPVRNDLPPPLLGEHTEGVLADWIGCSSERLSELRRRRIV